MNRLVVILALAACLFGCPKSAPANVAGNDDEQLDVISSQLEELRTKEGLKCDEWCSLKEKACGLSKTSCEIAGRHADRDEMQKRCIASQEDCARFNEACASCRK